jgi:hypothetical protein
MSFILKKNGIRMNSTININIKLYSGIHLEMNIPGHNPSLGTDIELKKNTKLKTALKKIGIKKPSQYIYFRKGIRIGLWTRLENLDEISCLKASGGG